MKSKRNKTISITENDRIAYADNLFKIYNAVSVEDILNKTINQDLFDVIDYLPDRFSDLIIIDPPYNLDKDFGDIKFKKSSLIEYENWMATWLIKVIQKLKDTGSLYLFGDWRSCSPIQNLLDRYLIIRNRITFERDKGRGAKNNFKNNSEDIWFATKSDDYKFNVDSVKLKRKVIAPYKDLGKPKDWIEDVGGNFRFTYPSNLMTDITMPFWSMSENSEHSTQKPEKLIAKLILASSNEGDIIFDPFLGSGTTSIVASKLNRNYVGVERNQNYCLITEKRLDAAKTDKTIQGFSGGVFLDRNFNN